MARDRAEGASGMSIRLGDEAPNFTAETTEGTIDFHQWKDGKWAVLFSHPADFTPVCTTELGRTASLKSEFDQRGVRVIGVSVDPVESHNSWAQDITDVGGTDLNFPLIADQDRQVSELYDMIHPGEGDTSTVRSVFIVDPKNKVRLTLTYPKSIGRNFGEIMRVIDALQLTDAAPVSTPVDWQPGDRIIVAPTMSTDDARRRFEDVEEVRPYLRWAKQPQT
jgi:thioredoxin-dependent peroxiredoxin